MAERFHWVAPDGEPWQVRQGEEVVAAVMGTDEVGKFHVSMLALILTRAELIELAGKLHQMAMRLPNGNDKPRRAA